MQTDHGRSKIRTSTSSFSTQSISGAVRCGANVSHDGERGSQSITSPKKELLLRREDSSFSVHGTIQSGGILLFGLIRLGERRKLLFEPTQKCSSYGAASEAPIKRDQQAPDLRKVCKESHVISLEEVGKDERR